jgi:hypothetical protein
MRRRRRIRRQLIWGTVFFGLLLVLAVVSVLRVAVWARGGLVGRRPRLRPA